MMKRKQPNGLLEFLCIHLCVYITLYIHFPLITNKQTLLITTGQVITGTKQNDYNDYLDLNYPPRPTASFISTLLGSTQQEGTQLITCHKVDFKMLFTLTIL